MLAPYGEKARSHPDGIIDLSQGTPVDPTPDFIQRALAESANSPSYPVTIGTPELRQAMRKWAVDYLGASGEFDVLPTIGSKELVAWLPTFLESRRVLYPKIAYPTYLVGGIIAKAENIAVDIDARSWPDSDLAWINSPSNPSGRVHSLSELQAVIDYSRRTGAVIASDECYISFPATKSATSILKVAAGQNRNLLAVHSLSKRSNLAGYRAAFIVGDPDLIATIREIRKHAGLMVPLPVQRAMVAALADEKHVHTQSAKYQARREKLRPVLEALGFRIEFTEAGLYLWVTRNESDWTSVSLLADRGILVTPGHFYGPDGATFVRIALTATDENIDHVCQRLQLDV